MPRSFRSCPGSTIGPMAPAEQPQPEASAPERLDLRGAQVRLRTTVEADRAALTAIRATPEVMARWRADDLDAEFDETLRRVVGDADDDDVWPLTIEDEEGRVVGYVQFAEETDPDYRHASIDIYVDPAQHRRGHATAALSLLIEHLFEERGHHRLTIDPAADNEAAIGCYAGVGFLPVGVMRAYERQADGTWADGLLMELLSSDPRPAVERAGRPRR